MRYDSIGFFYPTRSVGGAQYLFARMAEYFIERTDRNVTLIDYEDGFIRSKLTNKRHRFIRFEPGQPVVVDWPTVFVLPLSYFMRFAQDLRSPQETRLFFWDLHPYNLVDHFAFSAFYRLLDPRLAFRICSLIEPERTSKLKKFVEDGLCHNGIVFMAEKNYSYNRDLLGFTSPAQYLPLAIDAKVSRPHWADVVNVHTPPPVRIAWLSRLSTDKSKVLARLLSDVRSYQCKYGRGSIQVHIIGDGPKAHYIKKRTEDLCAFMPGKLEGLDLTAYIRKHVDVGFAMGTSALEFAVRKIPTVLSPGAAVWYDNSQTRVYRWLYETEGFNLSAEGQKESHMLRDFGCIMQEVQNPGLAEEYGQRSHDYVMTFHDISSVAQSLVEYIANCRLTHQDLLNTGVMEFSRHERILFGLKSAGKHLLRR